MAVVASALVRKLTQFMPLDAHELGLVTVRDGRVVNGGDKTGHVAAQKQASGGAPSHGARSRHRRWMLDRPLLLRNAA